MIQEGIRLCHGDLIRPGQGLLQFLQSRQRLYRFQIFGQIEREAAFDSFRLNGNLSLRLRECRFF
jgi:hypothetical protein